jgi:methylated-DNA-protein-cysteine methyltransferase related protein
MKRSRRITVSRRAQPDATAGSEDRPGTQPSERRPDDAMSTNTTFVQRVYAAVSAVPRGRVASYGAVAALAGAPGSARAVGRALAALPEPLDVPWWRVVNARGAISLSNVLHGATLQCTLLEAEGVAFRGDGTIDMRAFGWPPPDAEAEA